MQTEEEARRTECQYRDCNLGMRMVVAALASGQRLSRRDQPTFDKLMSETAHCIGSKCAHWRWGKYTGPTKFQLIEPDEPGKEASSVPVANPDARGYCGLAGKPE